jgi:hypothetical protein
VPIHAPGGPPRDLDAIVAALDDHPSVAEVRHDPARGTLVIRYDDRRGAARVLEAIVHDRLRAVRRAPPHEEQRIEVTVVHQLRGRVRLEVRGAVTMGETFAHHGLRDRRAGRRTDGRPRCDGAGGSRRRARQGSSVP